MNEQPHLDKPDLRTDAERFENGIRTLFTVPKKAVMDRIEVEKAERKQQKAEGRASLK